MKIIYMCLLTIIYISTTNFIYPSHIKYSNLSSEQVAIVNRRIVEHNENNIKITYPVILGLENSEEVNDLIKFHIYGIVEGCKRTIYEAYDVMLSLDYEIGFLNDKFLSIYYKGWWTALGAGRGYASRIYTVNIDLEETRIVDKTDIVENGNKVFELLMEDRFEFSAGREEVSFEKISREGFDYVNFKCYIEGNKFCVAVGGDPSYAIYTIEIDEIKGMARAVNPRPVFCYSKEPQAPGCRGVNHLVESIVGVPAGNGMGVQVHDVVDHWCRSFPHQNMGNTAFWHLRLLRSHGRQMQVRDPGGGAIR